MLAIHTGIFPLYEVENGFKYTLNHTTKERPVTDYLTMQSRYKHLEPAAAQTMQDTVDTAWARLLEKVKLSAAD